MSEELPAAATPGTVLGGKYRVENVLGRGGMGVVLAATHIELNKRVAVKLLVARAQAAALGRFRREAQLAAQLASPHIAQVLDFGTHDDLPFLVMELLEGHDLEHELRARGRLPVPEAVDLLLEGCIGMAHAHAAGLVHRDLKPANLFVARSRSGRRTVKVLDFGLTKSVEDEAQSLTASAEVFGTPQYMAPEQIRSSKNVDARCDQHALALVLFELIAGRPTYDAESVTHLIVVIATHAPPSLHALVPECPPQLDAVLQVALAKQPAQRFPDLGAFAQALVPFGTARAAEHAAEIAATLKRSVPPPAGPMAPPLAPAWPAAGRTAPVAAVTPSTGWGATGAGGAPTAGAPSLGAVPGAAQATSFPGGTMSSGALAHAVGRPGGAGTPPPWLVAVLGVVAVVAVVAAGVVWSSSRAGPAADGPPSAEPATSSAAPLVVPSGEPPPPAEPSGPASASAPSPAVAAEPPPSASAAPAASGLAPTPPVRPTPPTRPTPPKPPTRCTGLDCY